MSEKKSDKDLTFWKELFWNVFLFLKIMGTHLGLGRRMSIIAVIARGVRAYHM